MPEYIGRIFENEKALAILCVKVGDYPFTLGGKKPTPLFRYTFNRYVEEEWKTKKSRVIPTTLNMGANRPFQGTFSVSFKEGEIYHIWATSFPLKIEENWKYYVITIPYEGETQSSIEERTRHAVADL